MVKRCSQVVKATKPRLVLTCRFVQEVFKRLSKLCRKKVRLFYTLAKRILSDGDFQLSIETSFKTSFAEWSPRNFGLQDLVNSSP